MGSKVITPILAFRSKTMVLAFQRKIWKDIFQPFEQVDNSISRQYQGTGLGLALVKELVELHGGKIWAESPGLGKGSTFTFILPNYRKIRPCCDERRKGPNY